MRLYWGAAAAACAWALLLALPTHAQPAPRPAADELKHVVTRGIEFLRKAQAADGSFSRHIGGPGVTGLVVAALVRHGVPANDPMLQKALKFLEGSVQKDGGIYEKRLANYTTSIAVMALKEANADGKYNQIIDNAIRFLKTLQHGDGLTPADPSYGGVGYDATSRPDMSNMNFFVDALVAAGVPKDDPALKRTVTFLSHCQNLPGEHNKLPWVGKVSDADRGGFVYSPHGIRGKTAEGGLRSEGAMTYAGLKSFLYAGVDKKDVRVQAAVGWIRRHYTLAEHPGQGQSGLFYYYMVFGKAFDALNEGDYFTDANGTRHPWKRELFDALKSRQKADGGWTNTQDKFGEGDGALCTAYALLALSYCK